MDSLLFTIICDIIIQTNTSVCETYEQFSRYGGVNMADQVLIQFRADKTLKQEVSEIYEQLGMDLPTAFRMFMKRTKQVRGLLLKLCCRNRIIEKVLRTRFVH